MKDTQTPATPTAKTPQRRRRAVSTCTFSQPLTPIHCSNLSIEPARPSASPAMLSSSARVWSQTDRQDALLSANQTLSIHPRHSNASMMLYPETPNPKPSKGSSFDGISRGRSRVSSSFGCRSSTLVRTTVDDKPDPGAGARLLSCGLEG